MNFKTTYILFGIFLALFGIFALTQIFGVKKAGESSDYVLPSLNKEKNRASPDQFDAVEIVHYRPKEESFLFVKQDEGWEMQKPYRLRADSSQINSIIRQVYSARKEKVELGDNLKDYELDSPTTVVILKKGADQEWKVTLGRQSPGVESHAMVYVTSSERPKEPMAVKRSELEMLFKTLNDYRSKDLLEAGALNTTYVQFQESKKEPIILEKNGEGNWRFQKPAFGDADVEGEGMPGSGRDNQQTKPITGVRDLLERIGAIRVESTADFDTPDATDNELAAFGLEKDNPAYLRIEVKRTPSGLLGSTEEKKLIQDALLIGKIAEDKTAKKDDAKEVDKKEVKKAGDKSEKRYIRLESERAVAKAPAKTVEDIFKVAENPAILRNRNLVQFPQDRTDLVDAIDIKNASGLFKLRKPAATWKLFRGDAKVQAADHKAVIGPLGALKERRQVKDFPDPAKEAEMGFDKPEAIVVSLWVEGLAREEKKNDKPDEKKDKPEVKPDPDGEPKLKDEKPKVKLTFGKEEKDVVFVRREIGADKMILGLPASLRARVKQGALAYLDKNLPSFSEKAEVTSLVLERGGETYEIEKEQKDDNTPAAWKIRKPERLAGRTADAVNVDSIIRGLRQLKAEKLEAETAANLEKYGLEAPAIQATLKVKNKEEIKTEDWVYLFGKETDDKTGIFAKQDKRDMIFSVAAVDLTPLRSELQDTTVFQFDVNKVQTLECTGWKKEVSFQFTLEMERKGPGNWAMKKPPDFDLDSAQTELFVAGLMGLKADRFVVRQKGPQAEHKLGEKDALLRIAITVEGEKTPLTLTIGDLSTKDKGYYAQSSTMPGDVFLLPQERFEKVLAGPKYFSKKMEAGK